MSCQLCTTDEMECAAHSQRRTAWPHAASAASFSWFYNTATPALIAVHVAPCLSAALMTCCCCNRVRYCLLSGIKGPAPPGGRPAHQAKAGNEAAAPVCTSNSSYMSFIEARKALRDGQEPQEPV